MNALKNKFPHPAHPKPRSHIHHIHSPSSHILYFSHVMHRACRNYADLVYHARLLKIRILEHGYVVIKLESS